MLQEIIFDVSPGNGRRASSKTETLGGKPTLSERNKTTVITTNDFD